MTLREEHTHTHKFRGGAHPINRKNVLTAYLYIQILNQTIKSKNKNYTCVDNMKKCSQQNTTVSQTDISKISKVHLHKFLVQGDTNLV